MKYKVTAADAKKLSKHGIDLTIYSEGTVPTAGLVVVETKEGHFQEFKDVESTYMYYILEGEGTFMLNDEKVEVSPADLLVIPPGTRIHYFGKLKMVLVNTPTFKPENERQVRFVEKAESPYRKK